MRTAILGFLILFLATSISSGELSRPPISDGNGLLQACAGSDEDQLLCLGYILGVRDTLEQMADLLSQVQKRDARVFCIPSEATKGQMIDLVVKFLRENPEKRHLFSVDLIGLAFQKAWPCPNRTPGK
jgi:hypothetical protein